MKDDKDKNIQYIKSFYTSILEETINDMAKDGSKNPVPIKVVNSKIDYVVSSAKQFVDEIYEGYHPSISAFDISDKFEKVEGLKSYVSQIKVRELKYYSKKDSKKDDMLADKIWERLSDAFNYGILSAYNAHQPEMKQIEDSKQEHIDMAYDSIEWAFKKPDDYNHSFRRMTSKEINEIFKMSQKKGELFKSYENLPVDGLTALSEEKPEEYSEYMRFKIFTHTLTDKDIMSLVKTGKNRSKGDHGFFKELTAEEINGLFSKGMKLDDENTMKIAFDSIKDSLIRSVNHYKKK